MPNSTYRMLTIVDPEKLMMGEVKEFHFDEQSDDFVQFSTDRDSLRVEFYPVIKGKRFYYWTPSNDEEILSFLKAVM